MTTVRYSSNNSGGGWWLSDDDWKNLEESGWEVRWVEDDPFYIGQRVGGRWLGALAKEAKRDGLSLDDAIKEWENITGEIAEEEGCPCCGPPHNFYEREDS